MHIFAAGAGGPPPEALIFWETLLMLMSGVSWFMADSTVYLYSLPSFLLAVLIELCSLQRLYAIMRICRIAIALRNSGTRSSSLGITPSFRR